MTANPDQFNSSTQADAVAHCANVLQGGVGYKDVASVQSVLNAMGSLTTSALQQAVTSSGTGNGRRLQASAVSTMVSQTNDAIQAVTAGVLANASAGQVPVTIPVRI